MSKTLLEKAKEIKRSKYKSHYSDEHIELAIAYINSEINLFQYMTAIGKMGKTGVKGNYLYRIANAIKYGVSTNKVKIECIKNNNLNEK